MEILIEYEDAITPKQQANNNLDSFHNAVGPVIVLAQLFGTLPVSGILSKDTRNVNFNWLSVRFIVSIICTLLACLEVVAVILLAMDEYINLGFAGSLIFYSVCLFGNVFFIRMAMEWPSLIRLWRRNEDVFLKPPYRRWKRSLAFELRIITITVMAASLLEHCLYISSGVYSNARQINNCHLNVSFFKNLYFREKKHLARKIPYNHILFAFIVLNNVAMTLMWSFVDVFIMAISIGVARRYKQINDRLETARGKLMPESFWIEIRTHFLAITELLQYLDQKLSPLTLVSCANNLYFICFHLFNSFHEIPLLVNKIYFWVALSFICLRTLIMLFCASSIHDASKKPLRVLRTVPSVAWSLEVQRFTDQVTNEVIALSGKRFFFITRKLILAMASTVVTYELVLLDTIKDDVAPTSECDMKSLSDLVWD